MYKCEYFKVHELVPRRVHEARGEKAWKLFDDRALITLDCLHEKYGTMYINNWLWGGNNQWSGLRTADSPYGTEYSDHRFGRAFDVKFQAVTAEQVRRDILAHPEWFPLIMSIELDTAWLHFSVRNCSRIETYRP